MSVYSSQLNKNTGVTDTFSFSSSISDSYYVYRGYTTVKNSYLFRSDLVPANPSPLLGSTTTFVITKLGDKAGPAQLITTFKPILLNGNPLVASDPLPPQWASYVDHLGYCHWKKIELVYSQHGLYTIYPEELYMDYRQELSIEKKKSVDYLIKGDRTQLQRLQDAQVSQRTITDLSFPHCRATGRWAEILQLAQQLQIIVYWQDQLSDIVNTNIANGTGLTGGIDTVKLRQTYVHLDGDERNANTAITEQQDGLVKFFQDFNIERTDVPQSAFTVGGNTEQYFPINNFRSTSKRYFFFLRPKSALTTPWQKNYFGKNFIVKEWYLKEANGAITAPVEDDYQRYYIHSLYHVGEAWDIERGISYYEHNWANVPGDKLNATGSYNFLSTTNPQVSLKLDSIGQPWPLEPCELTQMVNEHNTHQQVRGDIMKNFQ